MSFLAPLYLLGALAVSLPILFHMIRRTPRGRQLFSSLMFLTPSPPRITRRSRIEHWLLLLLRAAALALLALAFSRPFLRESASLLLDTGPGKRVAIVVDTSASMRQSSLWEAAVARVDKLLGELAPADEVGLFAYDDNVRSLVDWDEPLPDLASRQARVRGALKEIQPGWGGSNLGKAMLTVADRLLATQGERRDDRPATIYVVSDMQHGSDTSALQAYEWPSEILVQVEQLQASSPDNASLRLLADDGQQPGVRVRVANAAGAINEQFRVEWISSLGPLSAENSASVYVPQGQSRVVRLPPAAEGVDRLRLAGDTQDFDNVFYVLPVPRQEIRIVYVGNEAADDPRGLRYFLDRVWTDTPRRQVKVTTHSPGDKPNEAGIDAELVVITAALPPESLAGWQDYVRRGGKALVVASDGDTAELLTRFATGIHPAAEAGERSASSYALMTDIDFNHPVFAAFAAPRYNDFTKVRIWKHSRMVLDEAAKAQVFARFDNGDPAMWEQALGEGKLYCVSCGWRPQDSQLALSSKFVPMLSRLLDHMTGVVDRDAVGFHVGESIPLPADLGPDSAKKPVSYAVTCPDGEVVSLPESADQFREADAPGIYRAQRGAKAISFAVNLAAAESDTAALPADNLEQLGVRVGRQPTHDEQLERQRQMRDLELESRQKLWRWLLVGVLGLLATETILAGRLTRRLAQQSAAGESSENH